MSPTTSKAEGLKRSRPNRSSELRATGLRDDARSTALLAAAAALSRKAENVQIVDVTGKVDYADFLVLMTGTSDRHVAAIAQNIEAELAQKGIRTLALEGLPVARWVLIDLVDVVVHVFQAEWREMYDLDSLWMDASRVAVPQVPESA
jgi:ribosome-associated protein